MEKTLHYTYIPGCHLSIGAEETFLDADKIHTINALITIKCDPAPPRNRITDSHFIIVLDTSESMKGNKLAMMKSYITYFLKNLEKCCFVTLIQFASKVNVLTLAPVRTDADGIEFLIGRVNTLCANGYTNITGAVRAALNIVSDGAVLCTLPHIILFTDGRHNEGPSWKKLFAEDFATAAIHTFSIGSEPDATQLIRIANQSAGGHYSHIQGTGDVTAFGTFIGLLKSQIYASCSLKISAFAGTRILSITGIECATKVSKRSKKYVYNIGPLCSGSKKIFLCELSINHTNKCGPQYLLKATLEADEQRANVIIPVMRILPDDRSGANYPCDLALKHEIFEAKQYSLLRSTIESAMNYAEAKQLSAACNVIDSTIKWFSCQKSSGLVQTYINELLNIRHTFATDELFEYNRNKSYALMATHAYQYGGVYITESEMLAADDISKNI